MFRTINFIPFRFPTTETTFLRTDVTIYWNRTFQGRLSQLGCVRPLDTNSPFCLSFQKIGTLVPTFRLPRLAWHDQFVMASSELLAALIHQTTSFLSLYFGYIPILGLLILCMQCCISCTTQSISDDISGAFDLSNYFVHFTDIIDRLAS